MYWTAPHLSPHQKQNKKIEKGGIRAGKKLIPLDWKEPTKYLRMEYQDWLNKANQTDESKLGPDNPHWYFRLIGCGKMGKGACDTNNNENLFDELPFFSA